MVEPKPHRPDLADAELLHRRWVQGLSLYDTFTHVWRDNPALARQAGRRVQELMQPLAVVQAERAEEWARRGS